MELNYTISSRDFVQAQRAHMGATTAMALQCFGAFIILAVIVNAFATKSVSGGAFIAVIWGALILVGIPWSWIRAYKSDRRLHEPIHAVFTDTEVLLDQPNSSGRLTWSRFIRYRETRHTFLLYQGPRLFNVIPKRALTIDQVEEFRRLLRENIHEEQKSFLTPSLLIFIVFICAALTMLVITITRAR